MNGNGRPHLTVIRNEFGPKVIAPNRWLPSWWAERPREAKCWLIHPRYPLTRCHLESGHGDAHQGWVHQGSGSAVYSWTITRTNPEPPRAA